MGSPLRPRLLQTVNVMASPWQSRVVLRRGCAHLGHHRPPIKISFTPSPNPVGHGDMSFARHAPPFPLLVAHHTQELAARSLDVEPLHSPSAAR